MKRQMRDYTLGAKNIRKELKAAFPAIKFSVRSKGYAGGCSIHIDWIEGPTEEAVEKITNKYEQGSFDGMIDLYTYDTDREFTDKNGGAKYVFTHRKYKAETEEALGRKLCKENGVEYDGEETRHLWGSQDPRLLRTHVWEELSKTSFNTN